MTAYRFMRRTDGMCPMCILVPKAEGESYCRECRNKRRREIRSGLRTTAPPPPKDSNGLTETHAKVLRILADGCVTSQLMKRLGYTRRYVVKLRRDIFEASGMLTDFQLALWAERQGYCKQQNLAVFHDRGSLRQGEAAMSNNLGIPNNYATETALIDQ